MDHDNSVFELRGGSVDGQDLALVRLRVGAIPEIQDFTPGGDDHGAELFMSVAGSESRIVTRETVLFHLAPADPDTARFVGLDVVKSVLEHEANIIVAPAVPERADAPYFTQGCPASYLNTTPVAQQCCYGTLGSILTGTLFVRAGNTVVNRYRNPHGTGCKASDGLGACNGAACYYGPFGFARAGFTSPSPYIKIYTSNDRCTQQGSFPSPPPPEFADLTGTNATGQGCPGGATGAGDWDY